MGDAFGPLPGQHVHAQSWPTFDPGLASALTETMVVQVNGKVRNRIEVDAGIAEEMERLALASPKVQAALHEPRRGRSSPARRASSISSGRRRKRVPLSVRASPR